MQSFVVTLNLLKSIPILRKPFCQSCIYEYDSIATKDVSLCKMDVQRVKGENPFLGYALCEVPSVEESSPSAS